MDKSISPPTTADFAYSQLQDNKKQLKNIEGYLHEIMIYLFSKNEEARSLVETNLRELVRNFEEKEKEKIQHQRQLEAERKESEKAARERFNQLKNKPYEELDEEELIFRLSYLGGCRSSR